MNRVVIFPALLLLALAGAVGLSQPPNPATLPASAAKNTTAEPLRTAGEMPVDVKNLKIEIKVDLPGKSIIGQATLTFTANRHLNSLTLDAEEFEVKSVRLALKGAELKPIPFTHDKHQLVVELDPPLTTSQAADLKVEYRVREPKKGLFFFAPTKSEPEVPLTVWSQGEPVENRYWIPCFDRPGIRQSTELVVTVAEGNEVLSNGKLLKKTNDSQAKTSTFHWKQDEPHPAYLITLVVGPFAVVEDRWRDIPVLYYVPPSRKGDAKRNFGRTPEMMELFSKKFGVDYPWNKYAQVVAEQFGGGMENTSATTLGNYLLDERAALDEDQDGLVSHELGHQWWGDLVTCKDWAHLWLNEGFASYCECIWDEHRLGADGYSLEIMGKAGGARGAIDRPVVDRRYPNADSMFDNRVYPKGAIILHMLRQQLGDETFYAGLKKYLNDNRFKSVETVDFRRAMEQVSGRDLERFFYDWTERSGHPKLNVKATYDADAKRVRVAVTQTQPGDSFCFPLAIKLTTAGGKSTITEELIDAKTHNFQIPAATRPIGIEVDPNQAVLAEVNEDKGQDWWLWQVGHGSTAYSRVIAGKHLSKTKAVESREALILALKNEKTTGVATLLMRHLAESGGDICKDALLAELKSTDPKRRYAAVEALAGFDKDEKIATALESLLKQGDPSLRVEARAILAYPKQERPNTVKFLAAWLDKPSNNHRLCTSTLPALADTQDVEALSLILSCTKLGKPYEVRVAAFYALARLTKAPSLSDKQRAQCVDTLQNVLSEDGTRTRVSAIHALAQIAGPAKSALRRLDEIAAHDSVVSVAEAAKSAAKAIRASNSPQDFKQMKDDLERLKKEYDDLRNRLEKYEKKEKKVP